MATCDGPEQMAVAEERGGRIQLRHDGIRHRLAAPIPGERGEGRRGRLVPQRWLRCSRCAARASEARCCSWHVPCVSDRATHRIATACGALRCRSAPPPRWVWCKLTNTLTSGARASCITLRSSSSFQVSSAHASSRARTAASLCSVACIHACLQVVVPLQLTRGERVRGKQE